jgi:hypothetical protein
LDQAKEHPDKVKPDDLVQLRRLIYQSLYQAFKHGRYIDNPYNTSGYVLGPNLDLIQRTGDAILSLREEENDPSQKDGYLKVYRSFLKDAIYFLYVDDRMTEANKWYDILRDKYPDIPILDLPGSFPTKMTMDEYAEARVQEEVGDTSQERTTAVVQGLINHAYYELALGQDSRFQGLRHLAIKVYQNYVSKTAKVASNQKRIGLPPFETIEQTVLNQLLDVNGSVPYAGRAVIRTFLKMPAETAAPAAPSADSDTNAPASK